MPKLLVFVPCDKVLVSKLDNTTSIISIIEGFDFQVPDGVVLPEGSSVPMNWQVLAFWEKIGDEADKKFEQLIEIVPPGGKHNMNIISPIDFEPEPKRFRLVSMVQGFPLTHEGTCVLKLSLREVGTEAWRQVADYSIYINHPKGAPHELENTNEAATVENVESQS